MDEFEAFVRDAEPRLRRALIRARGATDGRDATVEGVTMDPAVRHGKPCLAGTRVDVATVVGAIGAGDSLEAVAEAYALTRDQVLDAVRYAGHVAAHLPPAVRAVS